MYSPATGLRETGRSREGAGRVAFALLLLALLAGCASTDEPDLRRLYRGANLASEQPPLILIPGIMGSKLRESDSGRVVWPGSVWNLVSNSFEELELDPDRVSLEPRASRLEAFDITDTAAGKDFYKRIIETLEEIGEFRRSSPGTRVDDPFVRRFYVFSYDWRQDNVRTAAELDALIEQIRDDYGNPDLKVDIVAHSMGGLVARYFLRYGAEDVLDAEPSAASMQGAAKVHRLVLLGTPSLGSTNAVRSLVLGEDVVRTVPPEVLGTMASALQLLPNSMRKPLIGIDGRPLRDGDARDSAERDVFDIATWRDLQWGYFDPAVQERLLARLGAEGPERLDALQAAFARNLARARNFQRALTLAQPETPVKLVVFGADCALTPARVLVESVDGRWLTRFRPEDIAHPLPGKDYELLMLEPGDGRVTKPSLLGRQSLDPTLRSSGEASFPIAFSFFLCEGHDQLTSNINFRDNLLNVLLSPVGS